jgi:hypothetical protein
LHFTENESITNIDRPEKFFKSFPVISHLNNKFQELYLPNQDMPLKASKFGIKTYELCDTTTGYLWSFLVYTGKDTKLDSPLITADTSKTSTTVLKLVEPLMKQGWIVWMDNFYNSPALVRTLKMTYKTDCVGTLKLNCMDMPPKVKNAKLKKGKIIAQHAGSVSVTKWSDKKILTMISTYHSHDTRTVTIRGNETVKPISVLDYNKPMIGVDLKDQSLLSYVIERKRISGT